MRGKLFRLILCPKDDWEIMRCFVSRFILRSHGNSFRFPFAPLPDGIQLALWQGPIIKQRINEAFMPIIFWPDPSGKVPPPVSSAGIFPWIQRHIPRKVRQKFNFQENSCLNRELEPVNSDTLLLHICQEICEAKGIRLPAILLLLIAREFNPLTVTQPPHLITDQH